jgi:hypothetical protein
MNESDRLSSESQPRICLILAFLGPWPPYVDLYLHSIRHNPDIDWLFVCDHAPPYTALPCNVRVRATSKTQLAQRIADAVGTPVNLSVPYKLCDFRPAYGVTFRDELQGYDFWGHCDNDVVFGQVRRFITNEILASYDKVLMHGYMALYRNSAAANGFYRLTTPSICYQDIFADPRYRGFDEWLGIAPVLDHHGIPYFQREFMATPAPWRYDLQAVRVANYFPQAFVWDEGRILQLHWDGSKVVETEFAVFHLMRRKMNPPRFSADASLRRFAILPRGFRRLSAMPSTPEELMALNPRRRWYVAYSTLMRPVRRFRRFLRERSLLKRFPLSEAIQPTTAPQP